MLRSTRGISIYLFDFKTESSEDPVGLEVSEPVKISASAHECDNPNKPMSTTRMFARMK